MEISLTPKAREWIQKRVDSGQYTDAGEVIEEALRLLDDLERQQRINRSLDEARERIRIGEGIPGSEITLDRIKRDVQERRRLGLPIGDDVKW